MASAKTAVIQYLFDKYWDESQKKLMKTVMTLEDVSEAIGICNQLPDAVRKLSSNNPANFLKDVIRNRNAAKNWPEEVAKLGFTGEQRTGGRNCFEFIPLSAIQGSPYLDMYRPAEDTEKAKLQSLSMPRASKKLGRSDEAWLTQTAVNLRVIEQHMATVSKLDVKDITHLQMNIKLRSTEIDALYLATILYEGVEEQALITCEAKRHDERILDRQIINQVVAAFKTKEVEVNVVVPIAIRSVKGFGIHVIEFEPVKRSELDTFSALTLARDAIYQLQPEVKGI